MAFEFERPPWLLENIFTPAEVADALNLNTDTIHGWLKSARLMGVPLHQKIEGRRMINGHRAYILAVLAALHGAGIDCTPGLIRAAHATAHEDNIPRLPILFEAIALNENDADGRPVAKIVVELGQIWMELEPKLEALMKEVA